MAIVDKTSEEVISTKEAAPTTSSVAESTTTSSSNQDEIKLYEELQGFLQSDRFDVRLAATDAVYQLAISKTNVSNVTTTCKIQQFGLLPLVIKNCSYSMDEDDESIKNNAYSTGLKISINSLKTLLYLSSHGTTSNQIIYDMVHEYNCLNRMMEIVLVPYTKQQQRNSELVSLWKQRINYAMSLLVNMTRTEEGAIEMAGRTIDDHAIIVPKSDNDVSVDDIGAVLIDDETSTNNDKAATTTASIIPKLPAKPTLDLLLARFLNESYMEEINYNTILLQEKEKLQQQQQEEDEQQPEDDEDSDNDEDDNNNRVRKNATNTNTENDNDTNNSKILLLENYEGDPYQHYAGILMNLTQIEQGRQFVLKIHRRKKQSSNNTKEVEDEDEEWTVLQKLLKQLRSPNPLRRRGIAGMIKNCLLDRDYSYWFLNIVNITKYLLYPLAGPEELDIDEKQGLDVDLWIEGPDKQREIDTLTRFYLVECIHQLCKHGRVARQQLRYQRVYVILKWADMVEEDDDVTESIYECVNYLRADEHGTAEGSSDKFVQDSYAKPSGLVPKENEQKNIADIDESTPTPTTTADEDFDEVD